MMASHMQTRQGDSALSLRSMRDEGW
jgi:hypothetical protein